MGASDLKQIASHPQVDIGAARGEAKCNASLDRAAKWTEFGLLGNVALPFPHETLEWDGPGVKFPGRPEANALLSPTYRAGGDLS